MEPKDARLLPTNSEEIQAVSAAIEHNGRFLLVRRGRAPAKGLFAFPGGRVEADESREQAVARELLEETGLSMTGARPYREMLLSGDDTRKIYRLTVFCATVAAGSIAAGDDASEAGWFEPDQIATMPLTDSTREIIEELRKQVTS